MSGSVAACITLSTASGTVPRRRVVLAEGRYRRFQSPVALASSARRVASLARRHRVDHNRITSLIWPRRSHSSNAREWPSVQARSSTGGPSAGATAVAVALHITKHYRAWLSRSRAVPAAFRGLALRGGGATRRVAFAPGHAAITLEDGRGARGACDPVPTAIHGLAPRGGGPTARVACAPGQRDSA